MPSITTAIGRVLSDRYRLLTVLGTGASAHVYLADDVTLHRRVAVKVLHPALADDRLFLRRFRAEAHSVAGLNHPNILQVYDSGTDGGDPYLVLEYLGGGSLRDVYDTGTLLSPSQAVHLGLEATAGLRYAHGRGLVHRDIKPGNLLFGDDGRLRISDFGLARALAEASWTEPEGSLLGTARYASPEQVEGFVLDGKSDVYALALVLYEGLTGGLPFIGDTSQALLRARLNALLPEHPALGPLHEVLVWAAAPEPSERYDAERLSHHLEALAGTLPAPEPLWLAPPVPPPSTVGDGPTLLPGRRAADRSAGHDQTELGLPTAPAAEAPDAGRSGGPPVPAAAAPRRRRRWPAVLVAALVVAAIVAAGALVAVRDQLFVPSHPVPSLVGKTVAQATAAARADHFTVRTTGRATSITLAQGLILRQRPAVRAGGPAVTAKEGTVVDVVVSSGPPAVAIPDLTSFSTCNDAVQALKAVHLVGTCPASAAQYSSTVPSGGILGTSPAGKALYGSTVTIVTSKGHAPVVVPAVAGAGTTYAAASQALTAAGFVPARNNEYNSSVPAGQVIGTSPSSTAGPQPFGSTVTVAVSLGPQPVTIPSFAHSTLAKASAALRALGLKVGGPYGPPGASKVLSSQPASGTSVLPGTTVDLYTS